MMQEKRVEYAIQARIEEAGYTENIILREVTIEVVRGEFLAILGENGAGKTTLFRSLLQLLPIVKGEIKVLGQTLQGKDTMAWVRSQIGYVPQKQEKGRFPITVFDAVLLGRWGKTFAYMKRPTRDDRQAVQVILAKLGLEALSEQDCRMLSGGQMQRVNIARALVREPQILLLDEPTTHLDVTAQQALIEAIQHIRAHITVLMISHDHAQAQQIADRCITLQAGQLQKAGDVE